MFDWLIAGKLEEVYRKGKSKGYQEGWAEWANLASDTRYCENPHCMRIKSERWEDHKKGYKEGYSEACEDIRDILQHGVHYNQITAIGGICECELCQIVNEYKNQIVNVIRGHYYGR